MLPEDFANETVVIDASEPRVRSLRSRPWAVRCNAFGVKIKSE
jgi:hypothetical protein